jgi:hypothetical protein
VRLGEAAQAPGALRRQFCQILNDTEPTAQSLIFQDGVVPASSWGQEWLHVGPGSRSGSTGRALTFPICCPERDSGLPIITQHVHDRQL